MRLIRRPFPTSRRATAFHACALAISLALAPVPATADETAHRAAARALLEARNSASVLEPLYAEARRVLQADIAAFQPTEARQRIAARYLGELTDLLAKQLGWTALESDYVEVYMAHFSTEELRELTAFYRSPIGRKMVAQTGSMMAESIGIAQRHLRRVLPQVHALSTQMSKALEAAPAPTAGGGDG